MLTYQRYIFKKKTYFRNYSNILAQKKKGVFLVLMQNKDCVVVGNFWLVYVKKTEGVE